MSPEEQRVAIAEACGWDGIFKDDDGIYCGFLPIKPRATEWFINSPLPDYLNDLNAMHEAEKIINGSWQLETYGRWLAELNNISAPISGSYICRVAHATATQRAEAFLRTINKWID